MELPSTDDGGILGAARERGGDQIRRRHQAIGVLMMFVDADAVEAHLGGVFEAIEVSRCRRVALTGSNIARGDVDPHGAILLAEVVGQIRPRHQVEPGKFHASSSEVTVHQTITFAVGLETKYRSCEVQELRSTRLGTAASKRSRIRGN